MEGKVHTHSSKEKGSYRRWWHFDRSCFSVEISWLRSFCHAYIETDDAWTLALAIPGIAVWLKFEGFYLSHPQRVCRIKPGEAFFINDQRKCGISFHDWTLRIEPWAKSMEWCTADPWWVRGLSIKFDDLILGRTRCTSTTLKDGIALQIPMPEGVYRATAKIEECRWKRPRWFARMRRYVSVDVPKGIPFAGKGENSWDCGDDGLFGYSSEGESIERAIAKGVESVLESRRRYGRPSEAAILEALAL